MAIAKAPAKNSRDAAKAVGYLNVYVTDNAGKRRKVTGIALTAGNPVHEQIDAVLRSDEATGVQRVMAKFEIDYNPVDDAPIELSL